MTDYRNIDEMHPSRFLAAGEIGEPGDTVVATIADIKKERVRDFQTGQEVEKPVIHFLESDLKPWIVNKTCTRAVAEKLGRNPEKWVGQKVELYVAEVSSPNGVVPGIRVRLPKNGDNPFN